MPEAVLVRGIHRQIGLLFDSVASPPCQGMASDKLRGSAIVQEVGDMATTGGRIITVSGSPSAWVTWESAPEWWGPPLGSTGQIMGTIVSQFRSHVVKQQICEGLYDAI